jgi:DNA-binding transcriptional ArsR family regulator
MIGAPNLAEIAALVGDPARANILCALIDGRALTAKELAGIAGVTPQTASGHLAKLAGGRLLDVVKQGRHRYYRIATAQVGQMLESIMTVASDGPPRYRPASRLDDAMRRARTCYDHLAGRLGVGIADALSGRGHVILAEDIGEITEPGAAFLAEFGIDLSDARCRRRMFCRACLDWSERRPHLAGAVGAAIAQRCFDLGWIERKRQDRSLIVTRGGQRGLAEVFDLEI